MTAPIMTRFLATSSDPNDKSGVATFTYCNQSVNVILASFTHAQQLDAFMAHLLKQARRQAIQAAAVQLRGTANQLESDAA